MVSVDSQIQEVVLGDYWPIGRELLSLGLKNEPRVAKHGDS